MHTPGEPTGDAQGGQPPGPPPRGWGVGTSPAEQALCPHPGTGRSHPQGLLRGPGTGGRGRQGRRGAHLGAQRNTDTGNRCPPPAPGNPGQRPSLLDTTTRGLSRAIYDEDPVRPRQGTKTTAALSGNDLGRADTPLLVCTQETAESPPTRPMGRRSSGVRPGSWAGPGNFRSVPEAAVKTGLFPPAASLPPQP